MAVVDGGGIYASANSGDTWTRTSAPKTNWSAVVSSADGTKLVAAGGSFQGDVGSIYVSTNSGVTWLQTGAPTQTWYSIAASADGTKLAAAGSGSVYTSTNSGATWVSNDLSFVFNGSIACSSDGSKLVLAVAYGAVYTSTNSGATWTQTYPSGDGNPSCAASSADGTTMVVDYNWQNGTPTEGHILISTNSGFTWTLALGGGPFQSGTCSADGGKLVAVVSKGGIWILQTTPAPELSTTLSGGNLLLLVSGIAHPLNRLNLAVPVHPQHMILEMVRFSAGDVVAEVDNTPWSLNVYQHKSATRFEITPIFISAGRVAGGKAMRLKIARAGELL